MLKAYFTYVTSGLALSFINLSLGSPDSYSWDFGVTPTAISALENPTYMYTIPGTYMVKLTITKGTGPSAVSDVLTLQVSVTASGTPLPNTIIGSILTRFAWITDLTIVDPILKKWQKYLCILIDPHIDETQAYNELIWPPLCNELILNLVVYDLLTDKLMNSGVNAIASSGSTGQLKGVVTGPSEAEWFDMAGSLYQLTKPGGLYDSLKARICVLCARLRVPMEFCLPLPKPIFVPKITPTNHTVNSPNKYKP